MSLSQGPHEARVEAYRRFNQLWQLLGRLVPQQRIFPRPLMLALDALDAESLELRGCEGVCVVGAAAMPALPRVNPSLSCYAMGWRLGELLAAE